MTHPTDFFSRPPTILGCYLLLGLIVAGLGLGVRWVWINRRR